MRGEGETVAQEGRSTGQKRTILARSRNLRAVDGSVEYLAYLLMRTANRSTGRGLTLGLLWHAASCTISGTLFRVKCSQKVKMNHVIILSNETTETESQGPARGEGISKEQGFIIGRRPART